MARGIRFRHRGRIVEIDAIDPTTMVLDWLRIEQGLIGTKEGCREGDCGACTVAIGRLKNGKLVYEPANACILAMGQLDGCDLLAVDDLAEGDALHPVQQAVVDHHASQCGFCTPGFVMSLFTLHEERASVDRNAVLARLGGNLCRCTGYRPIVEAALSACAPGGPDPFAARRAAAAAALPELVDGQDVFVGDTSRFFAAPASLEGLLALAKKHPDATLLGGATDVGLWITKQHRPIAKIIHTGRVAALKQIVETPDTLEIGAAVTYAEAEAALTAFGNDVRIWSDRLGSAQVRAAGTLGGNIANGSPIGDSPPLLIALGAEIELAKGGRSRRMPLEKFFIAYGKQARRPGEVLTRIIVPKPAIGHHLRIYKISKRVDQDISAVLAAVVLGVSPDRMIAHARIAFGGLAGVPKRAMAVERALVGCSLDDQDAISRACSMVKQDFVPLGDHRASARYRSTVAGNLVLKAVAEIGGTANEFTRVATIRGLDHAA